MTQTIKSLATAFAAIVLPAGLSACQKPAGPAERAGNSTNNATQ